MSFFGFITLIKDALYPVSQSVQSQAVSQHATPSLRCPMDWNSDPVWSYPCERSDIS
jgi:hypothetical protein